VAPCVDSELDHGAVVSGIVPESVDDTVTDQSTNDGPTIVSLCALHVLYAGTLAKTLFRRRTGDNGT
jgi:hypothetical protein